MDKPLIFHWRQPGIAQARRSGWVALGIAAIAIAAVLWVWFPILTEIDWPKLWEKPLAKPFKFAELVLILLAPMFLVGGHVVHTKQARLTLHTDTLRYASGLPLLGRWLDWTLDLDAVRANKLPLQLAGVAMGPQPTNNYRLSWGPGQLRQLRPAAWYLPQQAPVASAKPASFFGLVRWQTPENQALLQQQFNQLPLIQALRQRGIALPSVNGKRQMVGLDLMAYPRMKAAVISFFVALLSAFVLFHLMRHHHYFTPPPAACVGCFWRGDRRVHAGLAVARVSWRGQHRHCGWGDRISVDAGTAGGTDRCCSGPVCAIVAPGVCQHHTGAARHCI